MGRSCSVWERPSNRWRSKAAALERENKIEEGCGHIHFGNFTVSHGSPQVIQCNRELGFSVGTQLYGPLQRFLDFSGAHYHICAKGATSKALVWPAFLKYPRPLYWGCVFHLLMGLALHKKQSVRPRASQASSRPLVLISASVVPTTVKSYGRSMFHASETQAFILTKI